MSRSKLSLPQIAARFALGCLLVGSSWSPLWSADWNTVGVLAALVDEPKVANQLALSEAQLSAIQQIVKDRENLALGLAAQLRDLPSEDRDVKLRQFVRESERAAFQLLNAQQRSALQKVRLSRIGMLSLADEEVVETVGLSEGQVQQVQQILSSRPEIIRQVGRSEAPAEMDRRLKSVLTVSQLATWQAMAGQSADAATGGPKESPIESVAKTPPSDTPPETPKAQQEPNESASATDESQPAPATPIVSSPVDSAEMPSALQPPAGSRDATASLPLPSAPNTQLLLNFDGEPWENVLKWLSKEAELSLQTDLYPAGTFTYRDPYRRYSVAQAMDIINGVLLGKGYSLVRRERVLMVLDLGSGESADVIRGYIREVAQLVDPMELDDRGEYELLKSLFPLSRMTPEEAKKEIEMLIGPQGSVIPLPSSSQVLVTETAGKLRLVRDMLMRVEDPTTGQGTIITLPLKNLSADELLAVVRPLLGLQGESNTSADINLSTDTFGNTIYATGSAEKMQKLRDLAKAIDVAPEEKSGTNVDVAQPSLKTHRVISSDPDTALEVLQTLMAGAPNVRLAKDPMTNHIIAFATPDDHALIEKTLKELAGDSADFTVIPLKRIDPQAALLTLEKFFGKKSGEGESGSKGPTFYGDTLARTIMVQGTKDQIDQVQTLIGKLEESGPAASSFGDSIRTLPLTGRSSERVMEQLEQLWQSGGKTNRIRVIKPKDPRRDARRQPNVPNAETEASANSASARPDATPSASSLPPRGTLEPQSRQPAEPEVPSVEPPSEPAAAQPEPAAPANPEIGLRSAPAGRWTSTAASQPPAQEDAAQEDAAANPSQDPNSSLASDPLAVEPTQDGATTLTDPSGKEIVVIQGPTGWVVTSNDKQALEEFEQLARMLSDQLASAAAEPTVVYLKYVKAEAAAELLESILSGEVSSGGGGGLLGNMASGMLGELGGGLIGGLLGGGRSSSSSSSSSSGGIASGDYTITPDARLNALIVQAAPLDLDLIEQLIDVIDQEDSEVEVETRGTPRIIPVVNGDVEEVANVVRSVFSDRIAGADSGAAQRPPSPQEFLQALRGGGGGRGGGQSKIKEMTMTIATDAKSNSLIVTSSNQMYEQVRELVAMLDEASVANEEQVQVVQLGGNVNPTVVQSALQSILGNKVQTNATGNTANNGNTNNRTRQNSNQNGQGQGFDPNAFRQMMMQRGFGGGGFPGGGGGFPGGGGGFPGGGGFGGQRGGGQGGQGQGGFRGFGGGFPGGGGFGGGNQGGGGVQRGGNQGGGGQRGGTNRGGGR